jgi:predicted DNA-binding protein (MmcQ/YjbR family)
MATKKNAQTVLAKMKEICLELPNTELKMSWGKPHYMVGKRVFAGCDEVDGVPNISFALEPEHADTLLAADPRFRRSRYAGGIEIDAENVKNWDELRALMAESHRLRAAKKTAPKKKAAPKKKVARKKK